MQGSHGGMIHDVVGYYAIPHFLVVSSWRMPRQKTGKRKTIFIRFPFTYGCTYDLGFSQGHFHGGTSWMKRGYSDKNADKGVSSAWVETVATVSWFDCFYL